MPRQIIDHFEDCAEIAQSLRLTDQHRDRIRQAPQGEFTSVGIGHIAVLDHDAALGIKKKGPGSARERVAREIVTLGKILAHAPDLAGRAPMFSALVLDGFGREEGVLTEDMSPDGQASLREAFVAVPLMGPIPTPTPLHEAVRGALGENNVERRTFGHMTATTGGFEPQEFLVGFHDVLRRDQEPDLVRTVLERMEEVTIRI